MKKRIARICQRNSVIFLSDVAGVKVSNMRLSHVQSQTHINSKTINFHVEILEHSSAEQKIS